MNALTREPFTPRWRIDNIGRLLNNAIKRFESRILLEMEKAGYGGFSLSHITITRNLDTEGTRATELARRAGITKQSMGELIAQLEQSGIIERQPDPNDRRAQRIFLTDFGREVKPAMLGIIQQTLDNVFKGISDDELTGLKDILRRVLANAKNKE